MQKRINQYNRIVTLMLTKWLALLVPCFAFSQTALTLQQAIALAQTQSIKAAINKNNSEVAYQTYRLQRAQLFPQVNLNANLPGYTNSITSVTQPDGTIKFTTVEQAYSSTGISLTQKIAATGGTFTASSNINRFDRLTGDRTSNFNTQPFVLGLSQPLFRFNETAFNVKVAQMSLLISSKVFVKDQEAIAVEVCTQFNSLLQMQQQIMLLKLTKLRTDTLFNNSKLKLKLGSIGEEEYLQIQLEQINNTTALQQAEMNAELLRMKFCNLLNLPTNTLITLVVSTPNNLTAAVIDNINNNLLFEQYKNNNPEYEQLRVKQFQHIADVKRAKLSRLPNLNLTAGYGSNQSASTFNNAYENVLTQRNATLGISMPIFTSGANNANLKIVNYQQQNLQLQRQQLEQRVMNDLMKMMQTFRVSIIQIQNSQLADSIAQRRYQISMNKYQAGKITYNDLLLAQNQQIQANQNYLNAIAAYWQAYYQLRLTTLYDVTKQEPLYYTN
ncbi:MAG: TolC family protein [Bacteroidia bacterium]|jgi:outer membrane protein TolC|nr:TolC family protein [Bacteroidia bacterium]